MIHFCEIKKPEDLDVLKEKSANFGDLSFVFSDKYLLKLKSLVGKSFQYFAEDNNKFSGYIAAVKSEKWGSSLEIIELFVDPDFHGRGIATGLVKKIIKIAKEKNKSGVIVQTETINIPAINLYKKIGFRKIDNDGWGGLSFQYEIL